MTDAFLDALFSVFPNHAIAGVYAKGSTQKDWDSPLDYVPELSDVDFHVLFADDAPGTRYFHSLPMGVAMQRLLEDGYKRRISHPVHVPRVQLVIANALYRQPDFAHSVPHTVTTLYGLPCPPPEINPAKTVAIARQNLLAHEPYLRDLPEHVADKPGRHLWDILRLTSWRVGPTGPRVLELHGCAHVDAWGANRTAVTRRLQAIGYSELANAYATYYLKGWAHFLSGREDTEAAREAILAAAQVLTQGITIAKESLDLAGQAVRFPETTGGRS
jgi:hypothetical protein